MRRILCVCSTTKNGATQTYFKKSFEVPPCQPLEIGFTFPLACLTGDYRGHENGEVTEVDKDSHDGTETDWIKIESPTENLRARLINGWCEVILPSR